MPRAAHFLAINTHIFISFCAWMGSSYFCHSPLIPYFFRIDIDKCFPAERMETPWAICQYTVNMFNCDSFMCMKGTCLCVRACRVFKYFLFILYHHKEKILLYNLNLLPYTFRLHRMHPCK